MIRRIRRGLISPVNSKNLEIKDRPSLRDEKMISALPFRQRTKSSPKRISIHKELRSSRLD